MARQGLRSFPSQCPLGQLVHVHVSYQRFNFAFSSDLTPLPVHGRGL
jgi:hypothetical protein